MRTLYDGDTRSTFLDVSTRLNVGIHLRPHVPETFDSWLAALLCWQPIKPKESESKAGKSPTPLASGPRQRNPSFERRLGDRRRNSESIQQKDASIIKVGKMLIWDKDARSTNSTSLHSRRASIYKMSTNSKSTPWRRISCTLQENGNFRLYTDITDVALQTVVPLTQLSRCAIQRLDPSVLDSEFSLAIYPQYPSTATAVPSIKTVYLAMESRVLFEVWFVLLRAFTIPDLYGPEQISANPHLGAFEYANVSSRTPNSDMFRVERQLSLRIIEAKLHSNRGKHSQGLTAPSRYQNATKKDMLSGNYYAEIELDGQVRGKTVVKSETSNPFWREDFEFYDLPPVLSSTSITVKTRNPGQRHWTLVSQGHFDIENGDIDPLSIVGDIEISPLDMQFGKVDLRLDGIEKATDTERWWPIINENDDVVGELLMKVRIEELVVLMGRDYQSLSELLHTFSNGLTHQIAQIAHPELRRLSETLLNIFQVSGQASEWIMSLVEDEIDNIHKETPISKFRYGRRIASNDSYESGVEREMFLRDLNKSATVEANLLFRGNSLLTKALDLHMRRLGKEYLEDTLCEKMRDIDESDPDCEVDPNKVQNPEDLKRNWRNLIALTENVWRSISTSASRCPPELRMIFRHIRSCADDRYGDFLRTVAYSSVSGFLFLRFFCPAVLNPKLFGLIKGGSLCHNFSKLLNGLCAKLSLDHPRPRAHRTLTLITKALQTLSNLTTFGSKEPWMEPMNQFLNSHRHEFKTFVDTICGISPDRATSSIPPSYATPITILGRLPGTSREGFPSLPYLIDQARECAGLVKLWLEARCDTENTASMSDELRRFDTLCEQSQQKTENSLNIAERADRPTGAMEPKWEELVRQMGRKAKIRDENGRNPPVSPTTGESFHTSNSSTPTLDISHFQGNVQQDSRSKTATAGQNTELGAEEDEESSGDETYTPLVSSSAVWDPGVRGDEETMSTRAVKDDDEDSVERLVPDTVGSSIYSLNTNPSNKLIKPPRDSGRRSKRDKSAKNAYNINATGISERASGIKPSTPNRALGGGYRDRAPSGGTGKSMYRLKEVSGDPVGGRKSPASRDGTGGILRVGDLGNLFKRKGREKEEGWRS